MSDQPSYFGCRLARVGSFGATGWRDEAAYLADFFARHADLFSSLVRQAGAGAVWDLRFVTSPPADLQEEMSIGVYLLGRLPAAAAGEREHLQQGLLTLLHATFPELDFEELKPADLEAALAPFQIRKVVGIRRRCLVVQLDSVSWRGDPSGGRPVGFWPPPAETRSLRPTPTVFHVCPFSPRLRPHDALFEVLRREKTPVAVSVRFAATELTPGELGLLGRQIETCERYAQTHISGAVREDLESLMPTLQEQARKHGNQQTKFLFGLRSGAASLTVEVASGHPLSSLTVAAVGGMVSAPPGSPDILKPDSSLPPYLAGGYESYESGEGAAERFASLALDFPPVSGAPPGGERLAFLFEPREAAGVFRFPAAGDALPAGLEVRGWRLQPAPANLPRDGVVLGRSLGHGLPEREIRLGSDDRLRHLYSIGQTGTGKSSLLRSMLLSDIEEGQGVCLIDPHGDLFGEILENIPPERADDVVVVDPTDTGWPVGINLLEYDVEDQRHFLVQELLGILRRLIEGEYGGSSSNVTGPLFWQHVRMNLLLAMSRPSDPGTLVEFHAIFNNPSYWRRWIPLEASDPQLEFWATHVLERTDYLRPGSDAFSLGAYISSKFDPFVFDPMLRLLFGQKRSTIRLDRIMDEGKILLVNLAKGLLTETNARFLGMVLLAKLQAATMARARRRKKDRRPFFVYVDEFQSLATSSFVGLLSEARKFGVGMVLANQFLTQIENNQIVKSILGNAGTLVCFRLGQPDAEAMEPRLAPAFSASDLQNLPNFHACVTLLARGEALRPFTMRTLFRGAENPDGDSIRSDIVARSRAKYARPRKEVEEEIERSLRTS